MTKTGTPIPGSDVAVGGVAAGGEVEEVVTDVHGSKLTPGAGQETFEAVAQVAGDGEKADAGGGDALPRVTRRAGEPAAEGAGLLEGVRGLWCPEEAKRGEGDLRDGVSHLRGTARRAPTGKLVCCCYYMRGDYTTL